MSSSSYDIDLYQVLQVHPKATQEVIDAAHKALLKIHAPRKLGDDDADAVKIGEAHVILSNPTDRRKYDDYRKSSTAKTIGPYRLLKKVAEGGFGVTYKAEHVENGKYSCIKHRADNSPRAEEILRAETNAIWDLRHYGLPVMRDFLKLPDGSFALAMSWIEGPTLEQLVEKHGRLDPENVAWIMERDLNILMYLHDHGVLHGDIKPANQIVQADHVVVMIDFGLSMVKPVAGAEVKGHTDLFSPPEQIAGKIILPESDFYSLGMTAIYALTGSYKATERRQVPADVPDPLCDFIKSLIVRDIQHRPKNARELFAKFAGIRKESFGRTGSNMKQFTTV